MKILTGAQIHELDNYTIEHEPIASIDLMERAARTITLAITQKWTQSTPIVVFAGPGNNGGDALAVARMLAEKGYIADVYLFNVKNNLTEECEKNRERLTSGGLVHKFTEITQNFDPPKLSPQTLVIDGLFGSGLNKPLTGGFASLVKYINQSPATVVSIDMPSGLMTENNTYDEGTNIIKANLTLTLQMKKLSMLFADTQQYLGKVQVLDIRLSKEYIENIPTKYALIEEADVKKLMRHRDDFANKGTMGNALLIAGTYGMAGAAVLATRACLRSGAGKVTTLTPRCNYNIMQVSVPEAVLALDREDYYSEAVSTDEFDAVGIGPGLGRQEGSALALMSQLQQTNCPIVLDADALNMLGSHGAWINQLPDNVIMTPHPKEFDRIAATCCHSDSHRLKLARDIAENLRAYILLKGHHSALCLPDGNVLFNTTGNSGMATAGSGDVLTGIITALLARGYSRRNACIVGMYIHGLAGDIAAEHKGKESLIASDIIDYLPEAFGQLIKEECKHTNTTL